MVNKLHSNKCNLFRRWKLHEQFLCYSLCSLVSEGQIKQVVNNVVFPVIDLVLAVLFFVKVATAYLDYRKHGQFEWTAPAILLGTLIFSLTCPLYIWKILGM